MFELPFFNWRRGGGKVEAKRTPATASDSAPVKPVPTAPSRGEGPRGDYGALTTPTPGLGSKRSALVTVRLSDV
ncbi:MAG: hypothetical protein ACAI38_04960 [Myxococcota bacterium]